MMAWDRDTVDAETDQLVRLVYELLDAHHDTARLMATGPHDIRWRAHLDYLQALQRVGRQVLAEVLANPSPAW